MAPSYDGLTFSPVPKAFEPTAAFSIPVTTLHHSTYPAISALRPELSQAGKTVLITGGGTGVGFSIAQGFASAGAAKIILAARRQDVLDNASKKLTAEFPAVEVLVHPLDVSDGESIAALWAWLEGHGLVVDVLVLNAGIASPPVTVGNMGHKNIWEFYKVNVYGHVMLSDYFIKQEGKRAGLGPKVCDITTPDSEPCHTE
jgi:NAD(P)-dependent dehydrogenase (short-subunit alcohol dehydrogenase family)